MRAAPMGILREVRIEVGGMAFGGGVLLAFIAAIAYIPALNEWAKNVAVLQAILLALGSWIFWEAIAAVLLVPVGGWYFFDTLLKEREFNRLNDTTSRETFLKNRKRLEYLGYVALPSSYERRLVKKKQEFKIRD